MNGHPTAEQKRFQEWIRLNGCEIDANPCRVHHITGSKMKLKGVKNVGEWYVLGLCDYHHDNYSPESVHKNKKQFENKFGRQKELWRNLIAKYELEFVKKPMSEEEYKIIVDRA